jgi:type III secretion apparatus needle protein
MATVFDTIAKGLDTGSPGVMPSVQPVGSFTPAALQSRDGFDLIWLQTQLQTQMSSVENDIRNIEANANLSDTEKMFSMQMAMNTWSAISNLRTNMLKSVSDTLKTIARNVN